MQSHWPHKQVEKERPSGEIVKVIKPLPDMQASLKQEAQAHAKYGSASKEGVYASSWLNIADQLYHPSSHRFMTSSKTDTYARKLVLQYRWGLLPTNRSAAGTLHVVACVTVCGDPGGALVGLVGAGHACAFWVVLGWVLGMRHLPLVP